jgi:hypothetical protein
MMTVIYNFTIVEDTEGNDVLLDFTPLLQAIHIHEELGKRILLKLEFEETRQVDLILNKAQAKTILESTFSLKDGSIAGFTKFMHQITGFFVIEATVVSATQDFRSSRSIETLWDLTTSRMGQRMVESLEECSSPALFLDMACSYFIIEIAYQRVHPLQSLAFTVLRAGISVDPIHQCCHISLRPTVRIL